MSETIGKYTVVAQLGEGGCGRVYQATDPDLHRTVAIKKSIPNHDPSFRERFVREARIAAGLSHPNIVTVHDFGVDGKGEPYLVQELLDGDDLDHLIARREPGSLAARLELLVQIARGLEHAHEAGIVHRDIKPANLRVRSDGTLKIMDFGIAKLISQETRLTRTGSTVGTVAYVAPEQVKGEPIDHRVDIFAFGVVAYELLTFQRPFSGDTVSNVIYQILSEPPTALRERNPELPAGVRQIVEACLAKDRGDRPSSFAAVVSGLEAEIAKLPGGEETRTLPVDEPRVAIDPEGPTTDVRTVPDRPRTIWTRARDVSPGVGIAVLALIGTLAAALGFVFARPDAQSGGVLVDPAVVAEEAPSNAEPTGVEAAATAVVDPSAGTAVTGDEAGKAVAGASDGPASSTSSSGPGVSAGGDPASSGPRSSPAAGESSVLTLVSDDARTTEALLPLLASRYGTVRTAGNLDSASGSRYALVLETRAEPGTTSAFGTTLPTCEAQVSAQLIRLPDRALRWNGSIPAKKPDCAEALAEASGALRDRLAGVLEPGAPSAPAATGRTVLGVTLEASVDGVARSSLESALRGVPGVLAVDFVAADRLELQTDRELERLVRDLDGADGLRVTRRTADGIRLRWDG